MDEILNSVFVDPTELSWEPTRFPGVFRKVLFEDPQRGLLTALFRFEPGARLPFHEHTDIEQTFVLEGSLSDRQGTVRAGQFVWRPAGSRHEAWSEEGCVILAVFQQPNRFFDRENAAPAADSRGR